MTITLKDVAQKAGVSIATVSRVLNKSSNRINPATKKKVEKAVRQLNYTPNLTARGLANGSPNTIGVVFGPSDGQVSGNDFGLKALFGIQNQLAKINYTSSVVSGNNWTEVYENVRALAEGMRVDSFILLYTMVDDPVSQYLDEKQIKYVVIGEPESLTNRLYVDTDNKLAGHQAAEILIDQLGVKEPLFISTKKRLRFEVNRFEGFVTKVKSDKKIDSFKELLVPPSGEKAVEEINHFVAENGQNIDGVFATDDRLGFTAYQAFLLQFQKKIPVVSFNNSDFATIAGQGFYSFDVTPDILGKEATKLLFASNIKGQGIRHVIIQAKLPE